MWLRFLPTNTAWVFLFGDNVATASIVTMADIRFFRHRTDAVDAARSVGLTVDPDGTVR